MTPSFCHAPGSAPRNDFVFFECAFDLASRPLSARWEVFADTRYRAWVNGRIVGYGPARFHPKHPEYDTYNLAPFLREGANSILVEAWSAGTPTFQSILAPGVFWSCGRVQAADGSSVVLDSPGSWRILRSVARCGDAVPLSFAIGPVEILDKATWLAERNEIHACPTVVFGTHGAPRPRSIPASECRIQHPATSVFRGPGTRGGETRWGAFRYFSNFVPGYDGGKSLQGICATWLHSETTRSLPVGLFWCDAWLNGAPVDRHHDPMLGNRQNAVFNLQAGWNFFIAVFAVPGEVWGLPLGLPDGCGVVPLLSRNPGATPGFWMSGLLDAAQTLPDLSQCRDLPSVPDWESVPADSLAMVPAREVGWDAPLAAPSAEDCSGESIFPVATGPEGLGILTMEFASEFYGHPTFEIESPSPCTVDVTVSEALRPDRLIDGFSTLYSVHATDRYLLPQGAHTVEGFHNRGGRYLQLNIRTAPETTVTVKCPGVREYKTPVENSGSFRCDSEFWNWCWDASADTLSASLEDIWSDSPWREQGCYLGDSLVQFHAHACLSADMAIPARILRLWSQCQNPDGQMPPVVPAHLTRPHPDFSLLYVKFVRDYWAWTGDASLVRDVWPAVERVLASPGWIRWPDGLISTEAGPLFIDWSVEADARLGKSSVLNALWAHAHFCAAELASVVGKDPEQFSNRAQEARNAIRRHLWDEASGRFLCSILPGDTKSHGRALHANALAWAWELGLPEQNARILPWLLEQLDGNAAKIIRHRQAQSSRPRTTSGQLEPYFVFFLLEALARGGLGAPAAKLVADTWGVMRDSGSNLLWESIVQTYFNDGSRCHSWSSAPLVFASRAILGVTRPIPGDPTHIRVQPSTSLCDSASGVAPHPLGAIDVSWKIETGHFTLSVTHPPGVRVEAHPPPAHPSLHCTIAVCKRG